MRLAARYREAAVLAKVAIEGDGFLDAQALHHYEAEGVAERVGLVLVSANEGDGTLLISQSDTLDSALSALEVIEEFNRATTSFARTHKKQRIGLDHNRVRGNQLPVFGVRTFEDIGSAFMDMVFRD